MAFIQQYDAIDEHVFIQKWPEYKNKLRYVFVTQYKSMSYQTDWNEEIDDLFILIRLLPARAVGKNTSGSCLSFQNAIDKLIVFREVRISLRECTRHETHF